MDLITEVKRTRSFAALRMTLVARVLSACAAAPPEKPRTQPRAGELVWITLQDGSGFDATYVGRTAGEIIVRQRANFSSEERRLRMGDVKKITSLETRRTEDWRAPEAEPVSPFQVGPYGR